jgi:protein pelota
LAKSSSGYKNSLIEALQNENVKNKLINTKASKEIKILDQFYETMQQNSDKVAYGEKDVFFANSKDAISDLLISDNLFKTTEFSKRKVYNRIVSHVQNKGGNVFIFSSQHVSGQQLNSLTGIAAILKYPLNID